MATPTTHGPPLSVYGSTPQPPFKGGCLRRGWRRSPAERRCFVGIFAVGNAKAEGRHAGEAVWASAQAREGLRRCRPCRRGESSTQTKSHG
eukprot:2363285-Alexandrium_andersonii.AAC.1